MTKKEIRKEKWTLIYQNSLRGMLGGLFSCVPFFPVSQLDRLLIAQRPKALILFYRSIFLIFSLLRFALLFSSLFQSIRFWNKGRQEFMSGSW